MPRKLFLLVGAGLLSAGLSTPVYAQDQNAEIDVLLTKARTAWQLSTRMGELARKEMYSEQSRTEEVNKLYNEQLTALQSAEQALRQALRLNPKHPFALEEFGRFLREGEYFAEAALRYEQLLQWPGVKDVFSSVERADMHRSLGGLLERSGLILRALEHYSKAVDLASTDARNLLSLAVALNAQRDYTAVLELLKDVDADTWKGRELAPVVRALALYHFAYALEETGRLDEAVQAYTRAHAVAKETKAEQAEETTVQAKFAARRVKLFIKELKNEKRKEGEQEIFDAPARFARAQFQCDEGTRQLAAERVCLRAAGVAQNQARAFDKVALRFWASGSVGLALHAEAVSLHAQTVCAEQQHAGLELLRKTKVAFDAAVQIYPKCARAHQELGFCHLRLLETKAAEPRLEAALLYDPLSPALLSGLSETRMMLGDWAGAEELFTRLTLSAPHCGPAWLGLARVGVKIHPTSKGLHMALDHLARAERIGADTVTLAATRKTVLDLQARVERGEKITPSVGRTKGVKPSAPANLTPFGTDMLDLLRVP